MFQGISHKIIFLNTCYDTTKIHTYVLSITSALQSLFCIVFISSPLKRSFGIISNSEGCVSFIRTVSTKT